MENSNFIKTIMKQELENGVVNITFVANMWDTRTKMLASGGSIQ